MDLIAYSTGRRERRLGMCSLRQGAVQIEAGVAKASQVTLDHPEGLVIRFKPERIRDRGDASPDLGFTVNDRLRVEVAQN